LHFPQFYNVFFVRFFGKTRLLIKGGKSMKSLLFCCFIFLSLLFFACEYKDDDKTKKCDTTYTLSLASCRTLPAADQSDCFFNAMGILFACDQKSYWKMWGCEDGEPCL
jgi:hypothetical protein